MSICGDSMFASLLLYAIFSHLAIAQAPRRTVATRRGNKYFSGGPDISVIFGPGGPNIMGVQISRDSSRISFVVG